MNLGPVILAEYDGQCGICNELILEGDRIRIVDGEWCHQSCAEDEVDSRADYEDEAL